MAIPMIVTKGFKLYMYVRTRTSCELISLSPSRSVLLFSCQEWAYLISLKKCISEWCDQSISNAVPAYCIIKLQMMIKGALLPLNKVFKGFYSSRKLNCIYKNGRGLQNRLHNAAIKIRLFICVSYEWIALSFQDG